MLCQILGYLAQSSQLPYEVHPVVIPFLQIGRLRVRDGKFVSEVTRSEIGGRVEIRTQHLP